MNYLLDTHTLLWFINGDSRLSEKAKAVIENEANQIYFSVATSFELAIKINIGKLQLAQPLSRFLQIAAADNLLPLPLTDNYLAQYTVLPLMADHRDPFDRMLIATAITDSLIMITTDQKFSLYSHLIEIIW